VCFLISVFSASGRVYILIPIYPINSIDIININRLKKNYLEVNRFFSIVSIFFPVFFALIILQFFVNFSINLF